MTLEEYHNQYHQLLNFSCGGYEVLNRIQSKYDSMKKDRQYKLGCRQITQDSIPYCYWSNLVNEYHHPFLYHCPENFVMAGMLSHYSDTYKDRQWWFRCCFIVGYVTKDCKMTGYINSLEHNFQLDMGSRVFTGAHSYDDNCQQ